MAMREGGFLFGEVIAKDTFRAVASMKPYDNIGTTMLSTPVHDRLCRLAVTYQDAAAERGIVTLRAPRHSQPLAELPITGRREAGRVRAPGRRLCGGHPRDQGARGHQAGAQCPRCHRPDSGRRAAFYLVSRTIAWLGPTRR